MQMTLQELNPKMFPKQNAIVEDFHVRLSALLDTDEVSKILEELYSLKSCGLLKSDTLAIYSLKTSKDYSTMRGGATFETIIGTMAELGYCVEWQVLNSKHFGVPQNRERVFIVASLGKPGKRRIFPIFKTTDGTLKTIQGDTSGKGMKSQQDRVYLLDGIMCCLSHMGASGKCATIVDGKLHMLTARERLRLQGFPDDLIDRAYQVNSPKALAEQAGNSVTVNVIYEIAKRLTFEKHHKIKR